MLETLLAITLLGATPAYPYGGPLTAKFEAMDLCGDVKGVELCMPIYW